MSPICSATPSSTARAMWARVVPPVMPESRPLAPGRQCGAPSPARAGTKVTPSLWGTLAAKASISLALLMMPRPSRSHCTAAPAMNAEPSKA
jgi:hypothetical protein